MYWLFFFIIIILASWVSIDIPLNHQTIFLVLLLLLLFTDELAYCWMNRSLNGWWISRSFCVGFRYYNVESLFHDYLIKCRITKSQKLLKISKLLLYKWTIRFTVLQNINDLFYFFTTKYDNYLKIHQIYLFWNIELNLVFFFY